MWPQPKFEGLLLFTKKIRGNIVGYWRNLIASDLGTGSTGAGTKYLADDMTWKTIATTGTTTSLAIDQAPDTGTYGLISGAIDGVNSSFTVSSGTYETGTLIVYLNGQLLTQGVSDDFQEDTPGIGTFTLTTPPVSGDVLTAVYHTSLIPPPTQETYINQTPDNGTYSLLSGVINGVNTTFTVSEGVYGSGTLLVYLNGQLMSQGISGDFQELIPDNGTFEMNTAPSTGDVLTVIYRTYPSISIDDIRLILKQSQLTGYTEFLYSGSDISHVDIYSDITKTTKLFQVDYTYTGSDLTNIQVERMADGFIYNKDFTYDGSGNILTKEIT